MSLVLVVFVWKKRFVFREYAELLSCVIETQRETADEDTRRVNRGLQHPLTSPYILMGSGFRPLRQVSTTYSTHLLEKLKLQTLEKRRERGDLIAVYRAANEMEKVDRSDLFLWDSRNTRGHGKKFRMDRCRRDIKKFSFPQRSIEEWNKLDTEIVHAKA